MNQSAPQERQWSRRYDEWEAPGFKQESGMQKGRTYDNVWGADRSMYDVEF